MSGWRETLALLLSGPVLLGAVAWLLKQVISTQLKSNADAISIQLTANANVELERLKSSFQLELERVRNSLQLIAIEHQVRYSRLHERRAELVAELYELLQETYWIAQEFTLFHFNDSERGSGAHAKVIQLYRFIELHKLYFSPRVCRLLLEIDGKIRHSIVQAEVFLRSDDLPTSHSPELLKQRLDATKQVYEEIQTDIPAAMSALAQEFRAILGVEGEPEK
jgi:hypothetical protein